MSKKVAVILLLATMFSCNTQKSTKAEEESVLHFDVTQWDLKKKIPHGIIKSIDFIPLETTQDILLSDV